MLINYETGTQTSAKQNLNPYGEGGVKLKINNYFWFTLDGMMWVNLPSCKLLTNSNLRAQAVLKRFLQIGNKDFKCTTSVPVNYH